MMTTYLVILNAEQAYIVRDVKDYSEACDLAEEHYTNRTGRRVGSSQGKVLTEQVEICCHRFRDMITTSW